MTHKHEWRVFMDPAVGYWLEGIQMTTKRVVRFARMIERRVSYFNGWSVSEETMKRNCLEAAQAIVKSLAKRKK